MPKIYKLSSTLSKTDYNKVRVTLLQTQFSQLYTATMVVKCKLSVRFRLSKSQNGLL